MRSESLPDLDTLWAASEGGDELCRLAAYMIIVELQHRATRLTAVHLEHGEYYVGICGNASLARYNGATECFVYIRQKFSQVFLESIRTVFDRDGFDVFIPWRKIAPPPFIIELIRPGERPLVVPDLGMDQWMATYNKEVARRLAGGAGSQR